MIYTPSEMVGTIRHSIKGIVESEKGTICTSHVERNNLTVRTFIRRFVRLSLGFSKKLANLEAAIASAHDPLQFLLEAQQDADYPGYAAGVTSRFWTFADLIAELEAVPVT